MSFPSRARDYATREVLKDLIRMYQNEPCLWRVKHIGYHSRYRRNAALDKLLKKFREVEPKATRDDVSKKINSMRSSYHKERRKIEAARRAGCVHEPKLWCFRLLAFLEDRDAPADAAAAAVSPCGGGDHGEELQLVKREYEEPADDNEITSDRSRTSSRQSTEKSDNEDPILIVKESKPKKRKVKNEYANDTLQSEDDRSKRPRHETEDRHEVFSKYIAYKLRDLPKHQGLLAEKLINDVLFEAQWGNLTLAHKLAK